MIEPLSIFIDLISTVLIYQPSLFNGTMRSYSHAEAFYCRIRVHRLLVIRDQELLSMFDFESTAMNTYVQSLQFFMWVWIHLTLIFISADWVHDFQLWDVRIWVGVRTLVLGSLLTCSSHFQRLLSVLKFLLTFGRVGMSIDLSINLFGSRCLFISFPSSYAC